MESLGTDSNASLSVFFSVDIPLGVMAAATDMMFINKSKQKEIPLQGEKPTGKMKYESIKVPVCHE